MKTATALLIGIFALFGSINAQNCSDLFISEYVVGSGNNRSLELYNPTPNAIDLDDYWVGRFRDGSGTPMLLELSGTIQPFSTYVVTIDKRDPNGTGFDEPISPVLEALSDTFVNPVYVPANSPFYFNGDDAVPLIHGDPSDPNTLIDLIGRIGEDPGTAWSDANGVWWTVDHTLVRKQTVLEGDNNGLDVFNVELEWDTLPEDDFSGLGWHNCDCSGIENVSFLPQTASICDSFLFNSSTFQIESFGAPVGDVTFYLDAFRILEIIGLPSGVTAETDVMATADFDGPFGYWYNSGTAPNQISTQGSLSMIASQATINGLIGGGPNNDGIYPFQVVIDKRVALTEPDISFILANGSWLGSAGFVEGLDTLNLFLQIEQCEGAQPCQSAESVLFVGLSSSYAITDGAASLTGAPSGGLFIGPGISGNSFDPSIAGIGTHGISYTIVDGSGCIGSYSLCTTVDLTVGNGPENEITNNDNIEVFPNPSNGLFQLYLKEVDGVVSYSVFDALGKEVMFESFVANGRTQKDINLSEFESGVYTIQLNTSDGMFSERLIKEE